jgi:CTP:molybdopterin cytidylyltransferase MocA
VPSAPRGPGVPASLGGVSVHGLLLAAGAGRRMGGPKALLHDADGTSWLHRSVAALREGGCAGVTVVLGAGAAHARALVPEEHVVVAADWQEGMGASLRAGLTAVPASDTSAEAVLVLLVDLPDVGASVVRRLLAAHLAAGAEPDALARAAYGGVPGHPVLLGRAHWAGVAATATGDRGARDYLAARPVAPVECGDLATGVDRDSP